MYKYAQIDGQGYIVAISNLSGEVIADNMIPVDAGFDDFNQRWDAETETWIQLPAPEPEPTSDEILEQIAINTEYLAAMAEMEAEA